MLVLALSLLFAASGPMPASTEGGGGSGTDVGNVIGKTETATEPTPSGEPAARSSEMLAIAGSVERIVLPKLRGPASVEVDALRSTVILRAPRDLGAVAARISTSLGGLCPKWEVNDGRILLRCRSRQISAVLVNERGKAFIDLRELRGLPRAAPEDKLTVFYDTARVIQSGACPGNTPASRGECAYRNGDRHAAMEAFKEAWDTVYRSFASLRLGDLAAEEGEWSEAALWWSRAGSSGPFGRLARGRLCELRGDCLTKATSVLFDGGEIGEPMRTELALMGARVDMYAGRTSLGVRWLQNLIKRGGGGCVTVGQLYCRRLILAALEDPGPDKGKAALELFLSLPDRLGGPLAVEMARAAGELAAPLGAPVFAGNLYASVAGLVSEREFATHTMRMVELYLQGDDRARAQLVFDYAETRIHRRELAGGRWSDLRRQLTGPSAAERELERRERIEREIIGAEASRDLADAVRVLARSRTQLP
ncbi:MAG TPA: hypothetical protein VGG33_02500 [Polyangia bacterium]